MTEGPKEKVSGHFFRWWSVLAADVYVDGKEERQVIEDKTAINVPNNRFCSRYITDS